eukprot:449774_1
MDARVLHRETIVDKRKKPVNIEFTICGENDAHIFYMQPLNLARKEVEYDNLAQYGNTLASKSVFSEAKDKLQIVDAMDIDNTNTNKTTKEYRQIIANCMINKANATD